MKSYWPVSNLSFPPKVLEKVVARRLNSHINSSNMSNHYQSVYRKRHSTESVFVKIDNHILSSMVDSRVTAFTLLDLSTAFDAIDHTTLLRRLDDWFVVTGEALDWFISYLTGRCQRIKLGKCLSTKADLPFRVPQGSVLGPLFYVFSIPLHSIA